MMLELLDYHMGLHLGLLFDIYNPDNLRKLEYEGCWFVRSEYYHKILQKYHFLLPNQVMRMLVYMRSSLKRLGWKADGTGTAGLA